MRNNIEERPNFAVKAVVDLAGYRFFALINIFRLPSVFIKKQRAKNREYNEKKELHFPLNGQSLEHLKELRMGKCNFAHCGCGPISAFNALSLAGKNPKMEEIVDYLERKGLTFYGKFGVSPVAVEKLLKQQGIQYRKVLDTNDLDADFTDGTCAILMYWWMTAKRCGAHYVTVEKLVDGIRIYNVNNQSDTACQYVNLQTFLTEGKYKRVIVMYVIE